MRYLQIVAVLFACLWVVSAMAADKGDEQMRFADGLFQRGFYEDAAREYGKYLSEYPDGAASQTAAYRLGESQYAQKAYDAALDAFAKAAVHGSDDGIAARSTLRRGEVLYRLKRLADADKVLTTLVKREGLDGDIRAGGLYYLAKVCFDTGELTRARTSLEELIASYPDSALAPYGRYQLGFVLLALNEPGLAAATFTQAANAPVDDAIRAESRFRAAEAYAAAGLTLDALAAYDALRTAYPDTAYAERAEYGAAFAHYRAENYDESAELARTFLERHGDSDQAPAVRYLLGNSLQKKGDAAGAIEAFTAVRDGKDKLGYAEQAQYALAWAAYEVPDLAAAEREAARYLDEYPQGKQRGEMLFLRGQAQQGQGNLDGALSSYGEAAAAYPESAFAADAAFKSGEVRAALGRYEEAATTFETFIQAHGDHPLAGEARVRAADARFLMADFEGAVGQYEDILASNPNDAIAEETLYRMALARYNSGDRAHAAKAFETVIARFPKSRYGAECRVRLGEYLIDQETELGRAVTLFDDAIAVKPEEKLMGRALRGKGNALYLRGDKDGAADLFLQVIRDYPTLPLTASTYAWLGQRALDSGAFDDAAVALQALVANNPEYPGLADARFGLAEAYEQSGRANDAKAIYTALHEQSGTPGAARAAYHLADMLANEGETEAALPLLEEASAANEDDTGVRARFRIGEIREGQGDHEGAARNFMLVAVLYQHPALTPEALWHAAKAYESLEQGAKSKQILQELADEFPDSDRGKEARERLGKAGA